MKNNVKEFIRRGLVAWGFGPIILVVVYLILQNQCGLQTLTINQVCTGVISLSALAFIAGGMNFIYQIERLPLMLAILIHGGVLYVSYLVTYLINGWLQTGTTPVVVFTVIFVVGYIAVWVVIYILTKRNTKKLNEMLAKTQQNKKMR